MAAHMALWQRGCDSGTAALQATHVGGCHLVGGAAGALPTTLYSILRELTVLLGGERRHPLAEGVERVESWPPGNTR